MSMRYGNTGILVGEDDQDITTTVCEFLEKHDLDVTPAFSGTEALLQIKHRSFDLVVCDLLLPGVSGKTVIEQCRNDHPEIPIIVISAKDNPQDKVALLRSGADDYLGKPFDLEELLARIEVQLRRRTHLTSDTLTIGEWTLNRKERIFSSRGDAVALTKTEFSLIELFMSNPKRVFTRPELFERVWGEPFREDANTVNTHISYLRSKLKPSHTDTYIKTVWGIGFKFDAL